MKLLGTYIAILCTTVMVGSCDAQKDAVNNNDNMELKTELDSVSYGIGVNIGKSLASQGMEALNTDAIAQAMSDVLGGSELKMTEEECMQIVTGYMQAAEAQKSQGVIEAGKKFLEENGKRSSVVTLSSGLQYEIMTEGNGPKPVATDKVKTHYHGTLLNGDVFDSSVDRGEPISFPVNGVIKGWTEALQLMPVGSKWKLFIPYDLAYGERGAGAQIGPFSTLIFEVELIDIEK
ncbi:FKBP-type peptidyl-prolyl cis-trans isomerase [Flavobacteriales bacterium]|jgi:FKBP-type peptidyl-prolyl cis-trans isomerase FklB|nr:FKBP-type peptidyl-prolyl cis-trans isomerase [Flavobacteriales bacterium]MDC3336783.1 FKBP-type peptidyl-prolyl cis-trans isomerase [Flavobacteriales bacterium]